MLRQLSLIAGLALAASHASWAQPVRMPCCRVVASNARTGVALARNNATGKSFLLISRDRLLTGLRIGTAVNFTRTGGVTVPGAAGQFRLIKPPKTGGYSVEVDCSLAPDMCSGSKPAAKLTMNGTTTWDDVIDFCNDEIDACVDGPV